jgi:hypothetical protein
MRLFVDGVVDAAASAHVISLCVLHCLCMALSLTIGYGGGVS